MSRRGDRIAPTEVAAMTVAEVHFRLTRSARRTLEIAVDPEGEVEVRAPLHLSIDRIRDRIVRRASWIRRRRAEVELKKPKLTPRRYVDGETHRYLGRQYRLQAESGCPMQVRVIGGRMSVRVPDATDRSSVRRALERWYAQRAREVLASRVAAALERPSLAGCKPTGTRIQKMSSRWGSCTAGRRVLLNEGLIRLPVSAIDYVIIHELCHVMERTHGAKFRRLLGKAMPEWRALHDRLAGLRLD